MVILEGTSIRWASDGPHIALSRAIRCILRNAAIAGSSVKYTSSSSKRARLAARLTTSRISEVKELMFSEKGYKLSHKRLSSVFPVNANEAHVQALISLLVVHALRDVAVYTAHHFDRCQEIMRPDSKGERNIETAMLDLQEDKNKTHKSVDCVARVISTAAYKFLGKRLVSLKD